MAHAGATDNPVARAVLIDIANEERVHAGEFARLLAILTGDEDEFYQKGALEVNAISVKVAELKGPAEPVVPTVGSLKQDNP
jgi:rubrerythrin